MPREPIITSDDVQKLEAILHDYRRTIPDTFFARLCADCRKAVVPYVSLEEQLAMKAGVRTGRLCVGCLRKRGLPVKPALQRTLAREDN